MSRNNRPPAQSQPPAPSTTHTPNHVHECGTAASASALPPLASIHPLVIDPRPTVHHPNSASCDFVGHVGFSWPYSGCATVTVLALGRGDSERSEGREPSS
eukprot:scaffold21750_cov52-Phaeocystis_antarctica.AAC.5